MFKLLIWDDPCMVVFQVAMLAPCWTSIEKPQLLPGHKGGRSSLETSETRQVSTVSNRPSPPVSTLYENLTL